MSIIIEGSTLSDIGKGLEEKYSNIRFLFQIDFSENDYYILKKLFQNDVLIQSTYFDKNFFFSYFKNRPFYRVPFLLLIIGFARYEYLDAKNGSNFFQNFLENILNNKKAEAIDFRNQIIDYFFKWRGISSLEEEGLYIFSLQNKGVSLKLKDCGKQKYINSFLYHAGCICNNDDLKIYLRVLKFLSEKIDIEIEFVSEDITNLYNQIDFKIYNNNVEKFFDILTTNTEIQKYYFDFIKQSIYLLKKQNYIGMFDLPIHVKNYLLFTGVYGKEINKINLIESDFIYQNEEIIFKPSFKNIYNQFEVLSFKIGDKSKIVNKQYDNYIEDDFDDFYIKLNNPKEAFKIEMYINDTLFKSFEIELFKNKFILFDSGFNVKSLNNTKEIDVPKSDEGEKYYIITEDILELKEVMNKNLDSLFLYEVLLDGEISSININNIEYEISFQPKFDSEVEFKDDEFIYFSNLPDFILSKKDEYRFEAINLFSNEKLSYQEFKNFNKSIGKFEINIGSKKHYKIILIKGFEIVKWFNWYENDKIIKIALENKDIRTNETFEEIIEDKRVLTFDIQKLTNPILVFNQINGENIHISIKEPKIELSLIDKRKNITKVTSKQNNIKLSKLKEFRRLKIVLKNFPQKIKFENAQIGKDIVEINNSLNEYSVSIKNIIESFENSQKSNVSIKLKNKYNYINIANIINDTQVDKVEKNDDFIKISDVEFLMSNYQYLEVYIDNIAYQIKEIYHDSPSGFTDFYISMEEIRQTKRENKIKRPFTTIEKNGLYVKVSDIKYDDLDEIKHKNLGETEDE